MQVFFIYQPIQQADHLLTAKENPGSWRDQKPDLMFAELQKIPKKIEIWQ